jgi:hypothetical protein
VFLDVARGRAQADAKQDTGSKERAS